MAVAAALAALAAALPARAIETDPAALAPHLTDWRGSKTGHADMLLLPATTQEVQALVRVAAAHGIALVPQGGNTGLVGGSVPEARSGASVPEAQASARDNPRPVAIVSTRRMRRIREVDAAGLSLYAGAGVKLSEVHAAAAEAGCTFPLSLGSKGSATIGGLVSTNAGGVQVLRHGTMRALVLGLEAVLPDGSLMNQLSPLRKDNSGYDMKQLLIGAEGTLGIVTEVALRLAPRPAETHVAWAGISELSQALLLLGRLRAALGETVESFEVISDAALQLVLKHIPDTRAPLAEAHAFHLLVEVAGPEEPLAAVLATAIAAGEVADAMIAASLAQAAMLWKLREDVPEAERLDGGALKNDVSVAVADFPAFHDTAIRMLATDFPGSRPLSFGHLGDGNLHFNLRPPEGADKRGWLGGEGEKARRALHDLIAQFRGSISAEHGIGTLKAAELARLGDPGKLAAMRAVKDALDPNGIMNPGKMFA